MKKDKQTISAILNPLFIILKYNYTKHTKHISDK